MLCCAGKVHAQDIDAWLRNAEVSEAAKELYKNGLSSAAKENVYSVMDSVFTENNITRPFYILLVARMLPDADEKLLAELNIVCRYVTESYPESVLFVLFGYDSLISDNVKELWAHRIGVEVRITCSAEVLECFKESRQAALDHCTEAEKQRLEVIYNIVRRDMNLFH